MRGPWGAQSVERLTLGFSSGHDPGVVRRSPTSGCPLGGEPAGDCLPPSPSAPFLIGFLLSLSLK